LAAVLLVCLTLVVVLNLLAAPLRERVTVFRTPGRLELRGQQAALRLDGAILALCLVGLLYAVTSRSALGIAGMAAALVLTAWRLWTARSTPPVVFDRPANLVWRGGRRLCRMSDIYALEIVRGGKAATLQLRYRANGGQRNHKLHSAREPSLVALRAAIGAFLGAASK
jgi:hypothetical protein